MIQVAGVHKAFRSKHVLRGADLTVRDGETLTVIGGSGTGKSVMLKIMLGLLKPDTGSVRIDGAEITAMDDTALLEIQKKFGYLFQGAALFDSLTVEENVGFGLRNLTDFDEKQISARVEECLALVGLRGIQNLKPAELSGGMKKRVGLARAIACRPQYIMYDEPTTGLDPIMADAINDLILDLQKQLCVTSIVVTHDMKSAYKISDRIAMLYEGKIIFTGTPDEVRRTDNPVVHQFVEGLSHGPIAVDVGKSFS